MSDTHFETIYEIQYAIQELIKKDNNSYAIFDWDPLKNGQLNLVTYNPQHGDHFLLNTIHSDTKKKALEKMYTYVVNLKKSTMGSEKNTLLNYSIQWYSQKTGKKRLSHFYGLSLEDVMQKFYYGKIAAEYIIYNVKLNSKA